MIDSIFRVSNFFLISNFFFVYINVVNKYYQKHKENLGKEAPERYQDLSEEEKDKGKKRLEKDVKILLKKKKKKGVSIIRNVSRSYLNIEEIII